ncbi:MAG: polyprenyl synthetase family protein [Ruminococcus sp.]|nr:polyprenyl synthetase family protein [Ruminococcus sp.]
MNCEKNDSLFGKRLDEKTVQIEEILKSYLPEKSGYQQDIMEAMEYSLMAGGKRLRPMLMQETYRLFGGEGNLIEPFMAAIEMIHTYSLVHDDLPAMDNDEYRRGRETTHIVYGEAMAILAGDALLNYAFETACRAFDMEGADGRLVGKALKILSGKAGIYGMVGGQVVDVESEGQQITGEKLDFIYRLKTGALIESSMMIGAVLSGASQDQIQAMESIAGKVGMAFQIQDDILDVEGSREELGKPVHSDEKNKKFTYVTWKGLEDAKKEVERLSMEAMEELRAFHSKDPYLEMLLESLIHRKK